MKSYPLIILSFSIVAAGCSPKVYPSHSVENVKEVQDSVVEVMRDTVYYAEPDSTILSLLLECDERGQAQLREINQLRNSQRATTTVKAEPGNRLTVKTTVDSLGIYLKFKERYHTHKEKETSAVKDVKVIREEVNVLHWWQKLMIWIGACSLICLLPRIIRIIARLSGYKII